jgi:DNA-binding transcriptional MerR regulator
MRDLLAFSAEQVCRLTRLSHHQLRYWDSTGFFTPEYAGEGSRGSFVRIYSFRDLVGLRAIAMLRQRLPLQQLREIGAWLKQRHDAPWSSLRFFVAGQRVYFADPETGTPIDARRPSRQAALDVDLEAVADDVGAAAERLRERTRDQIGRIGRNRYVVHNAHVIAGTRIPTSAVWNLHEADYDTAAIIREFPRLTPADIRNAIAFERTRQQQRAR